MAEGASDADARLQGLLDVSGLPDPFSSPLPPVADGSSRDWLSNDGGAAEDVTRDSSGYRSASGPEPGAGTGPRLADQPDLDHLVSTHAATGLVPAAVPRGSGRSCGSSSACNAAAW